jgi:predicted ribosomally synthesized peptide with SipW-like signal peptide
MKKIFLSLVMIVMASAAAIGATKAYFSDTEQVLGNSFTAGKLDLELGQDATLPFSVSDVVPGQSGVGKVTLTNTTGSIPGKLNINLLNIIDDENGLTEPELHPGYGQPDYEGNGGELDMFLQFASYIDVNRNGTFDTGDIQLTYNGQQAAYPGFWGGDFHYSGLYSMLPGWNNVMTLNGGQSVDLVIMWQFPTESQDANYSQNIAMTDILGFDASFVLNQIH